MTKKLKAPPAGSDAEKVAEIDGCSLPPNQLGAAADNAENAQEANEKSAEQPEFDEPDNISELVGGAGALPNSLAPAAANARAAERVSEMQAEISKKPDNPMDVYRKHLKEIADHLGPKKTAEVLIPRYGVAEHKNVPVQHLQGAIDELHRAADEPETK